MTGQHCERLSTLVGFWHVDISLLLLSTSHRLPMLKKCPFNTEDQLFVQYKRTAALTHTIPLLTLLEQRSWTLQCQSYHQSPNPNRTTEADNSIDLTWLAPWGQAGKLMGHPPSFYSFHFLHKGAFCQIWTLPRHWGSRLKSPLGGSIGPCKGLWLKPQGPEKQTDGRWMVKNNPREWEHPFCHLMGGGALHLLYAYP